MAGNSFGDLFRITTWGESHGSSVGVVIDGCPVGIPLTEEDIQIELNRRKPGQSAVGTSRNEADQVKILSGIFEGMTTGAPLTCMVENQDQRSKDYSQIKNLYRPGHADITWDLKYGIRDYRGGGRSSGRETISRVIAGAVAKKYLKIRSNTEILGFTIQVGNTKAETFDASEIEKNALRCADPIQAQKMEEEVLQAKAEGDSLGGIVEIRVKQPPIGLGEPVFDKLQADLGKALFSIATVKGIEFGAGFSVTNFKGSENNDEFESLNKKVTTKTNHAGGIYGGISLGTELVIRLAVKPASSITKEQKTITNKGESTTIEVHGRHDACILPRLIPVAENMIAITLLDHYLKQLVVKHGSLLG